MRTSVVLALAGLACAGCNGAVLDSGSGVPDAGALDSSLKGTGGATGGGAGGFTGGGTGGSTMTGRDAGTNPDAGVGSGSFGTPGNPNGSCRAGVPARGLAADTSNPTVVGMGTATSCTFAQLQAAVTRGGVITFDCGDSQVTIPVTATLNLPTNKNTVIDGGRRITLDGGGGVQILSFNSANFQANDNGLTLQHIALINGKKTPTQAIPLATAPCSQGWDDGQGGALYMRDGNLTVVDSIFINNQAAPLGPDTGGGAIYVLGSKNGAWIVNSTFDGNSASNAGAVGGLFTELNIYNSLFTNNRAVGHDANNNEPTKCSAINNGQNETGSGGNGGAIYSDGNSVNVTLCGDAVLNNAAGMNAFGGGLFFTSNNMMGTLTITDTTMTGNTGGHWTNVATGTVTNAGTAVGTNTKSLTISNSTLQGL